MPNHYKTKLVFKDKGALEFVKALYDNDKSYELCRDVMPMPELFAHTQSPSNGMYCEDDNRHPNLGLKRGVRPFTVEELAVFEHEGVNNWYDWANKNWGTKWGTYDEDFASKIMYYNSAWCPVKDTILQAFSDKYWLQFDVYGHDERESKFYWLGNFQPSKMESVTEEIKVNKINKNDGNLWVLFRNGKPLGCAYYRTRREARNVVKTAKCNGIKLSVKKAIIQKGN